MLALSVAAAQSRTSSISGRVDDFIKLGHAGKALEQIEMYLNENPEGTGRAAAEQKRSESIPFLKR